MERCTLTNANSLTDCTCAEGECICQCQPCSRNRGGDKVRDVPTCKCPEPMKCYKMETRCFKTRSLRAQEIHDSLEVGEGHIPAYCACAYGAYNCHCKCGPCVERTNVPNTKITKREREPMVLDDLMPPSIAKP